MQIEKTVLDNGMSLLFRKTAKDSAAIQIATKFGSSQELKNHYGAAHFLEHMAFTGSKKYNRKQTTEVIDSVGGDINAFTSHETTRYHIKILPKHIDKAIDVLGECMQHSLLLDKEMPTERNIILNEIRDSFDNSLSFIFDSFVKEAFKGTELGWSILGTEQTIKAMPRTTLENYYSTYYAPNNLIACVSGNMDFDFVKEKIGEKFSNKPTEVKKAKLKKPKIKQSEKVFKRDIQQTHLCLGFPVMNAHHKDANAFELIQAILGGGLSGRLKQEIREKRGLCYRIFSDFDIGDEYGFFAVYVATEEKNIPKVKSLIVKELERIKSKKESTQTIKTAKQFFEGREIIDIENPLREAQSIIDAELYGWGNPLNRIEKVKTVSAGDVQKVAKERLLVDDITSIILKPGKDKK